MRTKRKALIGAATIYALPPPREDDPWKLTAIQGSALSGDMAPAEANR